MKEIKIAEYNPKYAASVAEMWNRSGENWGGDNAVYTEERIISEHESSGNIKTWLALDGDEVVGYCGFSHYRFDDGALYVPLLNVRPDCHGRKIGKALVLQAVEESVKMKWPRLDLFTWAGNTKAVPLYKKCGFFWEKRDDTVHLLNFIPTVLNTDVVSDFFDKADWYRNSRREIRVVPDGVEDKGFHFYEYEWEYDGGSLRMQFERTGRGIRLIETDDYLIEAEIENHELIFGATYGVRFRVVNKSGRPLHLEVNGVNSKGIDFDCHHRVSVSGEEIIAGEFFVHNTSEDISKWRTHPAVTAEVTINDKKAIFKVGIKPKYPLELSLGVPDREYYKNTPAALYLNLKSNFTEKAVFFFDLPEHPTISLSKRHFEIELEPQEKKCIEVPLELRDFDFYQAEVDITAMLKNRKVKFSKRIGAGFGGQNGCFGGETDTHWYIYNGKYVAKLDKETNEIALYELGRDYRNMFFFPPKLGKPFSDEFTRKKPKDAEVRIENDAVLLKLEHESEEFTGIRVATYYKLFSNGILEHYYEVQNITENECPTELELQQAFFCNTYGVTLPYDNAIVQVKDDIDSNMYPWKADRITENWLFGRKGETTWGICWPSEQKLQDKGWHTAINHPLGKLQGGTTIRTAPMIMILNTFRDWRSFRCFAQGCIPAAAVQTKDALALEINNGNPFVTSECIVGAKMHRAIAIDGEVQIVSETNRFRDSSIKFTKNSPLSESQTILTPISDGMDIVTFDVGLTHTSYQRKQVVFSVGTKDVMMQHDDVYTVANGVLEIKADPAYAPGIYSLKHKGNEWLASAYPTPGPKMWWNPWVGGISTYPQPLIMRSMLKERISTDFAELLDNQGNRWQGIKTTVDVKQYEQFRGLRLHQYFLCLPGTPVLCNVNEIEQNMGEFTTLTLHTETFLSMGDNNQQGWFAAAKENYVDTTRYMTGKDDQEITGESSIIYARNDRNRKLQILSDADVMYAYTNTETTDNRIVNKLPACNGRSFFTAPVFYIFTNRVCTREELKPLLSIRFHKE